jgi:pimeloyl-ACP methyl ester carboxylesterase
MNYPSNPPTESWPRFRSAAGEVAFRAAYAAALALWPLPPEPQDVPTRFGPTHANACGPRDGPPLVLVPGGLMSAPYWYLNIAALAQRFRVYALDTIGDYGLSVLQRRLRDRHNCALWLQDVLDGLGLERAHLAGHSYGGWLACNLALLAPERVERLVLLAPADTLQPMRWGFFFGRVLPMLMFPARSRVGHFMQYVSATPHAAEAFKELVEQIYLGVKHIGLPHTVQPCVFRDDELRRIAAPTLVLIGDREVIYDPRAALQRATRLIPQVQTEIVPGAGHDLMRDQPTQVSQRIVDFLRAGGGPLATGELTQCACAVAQAPAEAVPQALVADLGLRHEQEG